MWQVRYIDEALEDLDKLDVFLRKLVIAGIKKVSHSPLPQNEGGYGKPLGNKRGNNLVGFFKIKYKRYGIRVVYTLVRDKKIMNIIVISKREDNVCYKETKKRKENYKDKLFKDSFSDLNKEQE
jgi:mRNA interferase RelE/StbE